MTGEPARPGRLAALSFALLAVLAGLLLAPLLGFGRPPRELVLAVLAARLAVQIARARTETALRRPARWIVEAALLVLLAGAAG